MKIDWASLPEAERVQLMTELIGKPIQISSKPFREGVRKAGPFLGPFIGTQVKVDGVKRNAHGDFFMFKAGTEILSVLVEVTQPVSA